MDPRMPSSPSPRHSPDPDIRELEDFRYALDQSAIVATTDVTGIIRHVNDKFCEISEYSREELLGQDHRIVNSGHHPKAFIRNLWRTIASGKVWRGEICNRAKSGRLYWVDTTIVPFLDDRGKPYQYVAIRYDISDRKLAEQKLVDQASLARLGEMAAVVAHEVRNPLAGLRGALQILAQRLQDERSERGIILEMIKRLDALNDRVNDMLRYAKPRSPELTRVPLKSLLEATAELARRDQTMSELAITVEGGELAAHGDPEMLREVFLNLIMNAGQAMEGRGTVRVSVEGGNAAIVRIADTGPGMSGDLLERIFEPFFTTKRTGTGLGLAIVRRLLELQDGTVDVEVTSPAGTSVRVRLPLAPGSHT
jgi:PAS domain S-box-containing protein